MTDADELQAAYDIIATERAEVLRLRKEVELLRADRDRLDFLDECNARLNERSGTKYGWEMRINHNVNRLMTRQGHLTVDLNDMKAHGTPSCRNAIDGEMARIANYRAALQESSHD